VTCPTPDKRRSRAAARRRPRRNGSAQRYTLKGQLRPYRCDCGDWHLTHLSGKNRQLDRRKRRANAAARAAA
jgi:hypothetical protein